MAIHQQGYINSGFCRLISRHTYRMCDTDFQHAISKLLEKVPRKELLAQDFLIAYKLKKTRYYPRSTQISFCVFVTYYKHSIVLKIKIKFKNMQQLCAGSFAISALLIV